MERFARLLLGISGAIFMGYGVICWLDPEKPAELAGLFVATHNGYAEMAAMYGGLQLGFGSILFVSAFMKSYLRPGLWLIAICIGNLAVARGSVAFRGVDPTFDLAAGRVGITMSSGFTAYTWAALAFEAFIVLGAIVALISLPKSS